MKKNLTLTGMMGVGKTTIGKAVSKRLLMEFIDIDRIIEKNLNLSIQIFFLLFYLKHISHTPDWIEQLDISFFTNYFFSNFFGSRLIGGVYLITLIYLI